VLVLYPWLPFVAPSVLGIEPGLLGYQGLAFTNMNRANWRWPN
jgi:hypothetical protein